MESIPELFKTIGGTTKVADWLGVKASTASEMKRRGSIPVKYWPRLVDQCRENGVRGVNYDVLVDLHEKKGRAA